MQRILILGSGGAGKSTLAGKIAQRTKLPIIHLDQHYWKPHWIESSKEEWTERVKELIQKEQWIMDGNYGGTLELRIPRADTIIFMNTSRWLCLYRVFRRWWKYRNTSRPDITENCPEQLNWEFLHYIFVYPFTRRPKILKRLEELKDTHKIYVLSSSKAIDQFLNSIVSR